MTSSLLPRLAQALVAITTLALLAPGSARASRAVELPSVLVIAKSSNRNQVHYAALLGDDCSPATAAPVHPYWRMLERGPSDTEPLEHVEERWLGLAYQDVGASTIRLALRALPSRAFVVHTARLTDGRCTSWVATTIAGGQARLSRVYVQQKLFGIDYVELTGWHEDGALVTERVPL